MQLFQKPNRIFFLNVPPIAGGLLLALGLASCSPSKPAAQPEPPVVTVVHPVQREIQEWDEYTGRLAAPDTVEVRARVGGFLQSINFKDGSVVEKDDLLFVIDPRPYQAALHGAESAVQQAQAQQALAQANLLRAQDLRKKSVIAQEDFDTNLNNFKIAQAGVAAAQAQVETAQLNLDFTNVRSPVRGRVSRNYVSVGNLIGGGSDTSTLLTTVVSLDPIYCYFEVDEHSFLKYKGLTARKSDSPEIQSGPSAEKIPVEMELGNEVGFPHQGYLDFVDNRLDQQTATVQLRGLFANNDLKLTPGLFARARIPGAPRHEAVLVPDQAIGADQNQQFVSVVGPDNKVIYRRVDPGPMIDNLRIIRSGLTKEDRIVAIGMQRAKPGTVVKPEEKTVDEVMQPAAASATSPSAGSAHQP